ncbi:MAG TPA: ATP-grasp domain-containing protein, partial [Sandaracinaceae bacterium]
YGVRGAGVDRARMWRDKVAMKARVRAAGLKTAEHVAVDRKSDADALVGALGLPVVLKPRDASGGRGLVLAHDREEVRAALADGWMAERFVHGVELSVESLVQHGRVLFENVTEYLRPGWANLVPASLPERVDAAVRRLNRAAIEALEVEDGLTHLEAFVTNGDADGEPSIVFGELACRPPGGSLMELLQRAYGFDPWQSHLELELGRPTVPPGPPRRTAGVWFLHPGEGRVVAIEGLESARAVPGIATVECSLELGQLVAARRGVGEHTGRIVSEAGTRDEAARALETARALIRLETEPVAGPHP